MGTILEIGKLTIEIFKLFSTVDGRKRLLENIRYNKEIFIFLIPVTFYSVIVLIGFIFRKYYGFDTSVILNDNSWIVLSNFALIVLMFLISLPIQNKYSRTFFKYLTDNKKEFFQVEENVPIYPNIKRTSKAVLLFKEFWFLTVIFWLIFYIFACVDMFIFGPINIELDKGLKVFIYNILNLTSTVTFICCVIVLAKETFEVNGKVIILKMPILAKFILIFSILLALFDLWAQLSSFIGWRFISSMLIGLLGGLSLCFFAGRIDSKFINLSGVLILVLFLYSFAIAFFPIIQVHQHGYINSFIKENIGNEEIIGLNHVMEKINRLISYLMFLEYHAGLVFKTLLVITLTYLYKSNRMFIYFLRMNLTNDTISKYNNLLNSQFKSIATQNNSK